MINQSVFSHWWVSVTVESEYKWVVRSLSVSEASKAVQLDVFGEVTWGSECLKGCRWRS